MKEEKMSMIIYDAADLRAAAARARLTKKEIAEALGLSADYVRRIMAGSRDAEARRAQIQEFILEKSREQ